MKRIDLWLSLSVGMYIALWLFVMAISIWAILKPVPIC